MKMTRLKELEIQDRQLFATDGETNLENKILWLTMN